jgi:DNA-binding response OmpR family regulator
LTTNHQLPFSILIATPDEQWLNHLSQVLQKNRFRVAVTTDGHEAVRISREEDTRMMILDTNLTGLNGYEATQMIRQSGNQVMVILLLAWFTLQSMEMAFALGCNELIAKPVNTDELLEIILKWTTGSIPENNIELKETGPDEH